MLEKSFLHVHAKVQLYIAFQISLRITYPALAVGSGRSMGLWDRISCSFKHIFRESNIVADVYSSLVIEGLWKFHQWAGESTSEKSEGNN